MRTRASAEVYRMQRSPVYKQQIAVHHNCINTSRSSTYMIRATCMILQAKAYLDQRYGLVERRTGVLVALRGPPSRLDSHLYTSPMSVLVKLTSFLHHPLILGCFDCTCDGALTEEGPAASRDAPAAIGAAINAPAAPVAVATELAEACASSEGANCSDLEDSAYNCAGGSDAFCIATAAPSVSIARDSAAFDDATGATSGSAA
jgi:hypothetical protein